MRPLSGIVRRLIGGTTSAASPSEGSQTDTRRRSSNDDQSTGDRPRRRRGQRGGRGRNKKRGEVENKDSFSKPNRASGNSPSGTAARRRKNSNVLENSPDRDRRNDGYGEDRKNSYTWGRVARSEQDRLQGNRQRERARKRRGFRPSRESLEGPLPEDVAFRSVEEGGADDILPARRRRPSGIRSTERVIVGGARSLSGIPRTMGGGSTPTHSEDSTAESEGAFGDHPEKVAGDSDDPPTEPDTQKLRRGGGKSPATREAALTRAEAEEDDDIPVDHDHVIEAIEELPAIIEHDIEELEQDFEVPAAFTGLGLSDESLVAITRLGHTDPTPIQARAIPELLDGNDVVGIAQTGSGKTLAFGLPMIESIDADMPEIQAIVLVPTRELAQQVLDVLDDLGRSYGLRTVGLLGGHALKRDFAALREQPQIVVGTPGRIIDHLRRETLSLRYVGYAVLDEADQMLDIGFLPDIRRILGRTPRRRQTALFSATMPTSIRRLIWQFMNDPVTAKVDAELSTVDSVKQIYFEVAQRDKARGLRELVDRELKGQTLVFCKMKRGVDRLAQDLEGTGVRVGALHGDMDQRRRDRVVQRFRSGELDILIATNVAARGLDIPEITHVVNFDVPQNAEEYVHRIGRTGRAGRKGKAITFVGEWEFDEFQRVYDEFSESLNKEELSLYQSK